MKKGNKGKEEKKPLEESLEDQMENTTFNEKEFVGRPTKIKSQVSLQSNVPKNQVHTNNVIALNKQSNNLKLEKDLDRIININSLIEKSINSIQRSQNQQEILVTNLAEIGQLIHDISWDELNLDCIRNKHGYRDRYKEKGNEIKRDGAKLGFETLGHLKDLALDKNFNWLLTTELKLLNDSLATLQEKVYFILSKEYLNLSEEQKLEINCIDHSKFMSTVHNQEEGFIKKAAAYYHDRKCINKLISLLEPLEKSDKNVALKSPYESLNLSNKIDRYWLGYFLTLVGEAAKEISDYIKPEIDHTPSLSRSLFKKLRDYRQKLKNSPHIVEDDNYTALLQMKLRLEEVAPSLLELLTKLKDLLSNEFNTIEAMVTYEKIHSEFEKTFESTAEIKKIMYILKSGVDNLKKTLRNIDKEIARESEVKTALQQKKENTENPSIKVEDIATPSSDTTSQAEDLLKNLLRNHNVSLIKNLLTSYLNNCPDGNKLTFKVFKIRLQQSAESWDYAIKEERNCIKDKLKQAGKDGKAKALIGKQTQETLKKEFINPSKGITDLYKAIKDLNDVELEDILVSDLREALEKTGVVVDCSKDSETISRELKEIILKKDKLIEKKQQEKVVVERILNKIKVKHLSSIPYSDPTAPPFSLINKQKSQADEDPIIVFLEKVNTEIENLSSISRSTDSSKIAFARKMSMGFIRGYYKKIFQGEDYAETIKEFSHQDFLFQQSVAVTIAVGHERIMHQAVSNDTEETNNILRDVAATNIFPWAENFYALIFLLSEKLGFSDRILNFFPKELFNDYSNLEKKLITLHIIITSNIRLQNYSKVEKYFQSSKEELDHIIQSVGEGYKWAAGIYVDHFSSLKILGKIKEAKDVALHFLSMVENKPEFEQVSEDLQVGLLLITPELCSKFEISSFKSPDGWLGLIDAYLELDMCDESFQAIHMIPKLLINNLTIYQTYHYAHICAKYYRVLIIKLLHTDFKKLTSSVDKPIKINFSEINDCFKREIKWLNSCEENLIKNKEAFIKEVGTLYNNNLFLIKAEQAWNRCMLAETISKYVINKEEIDLKSIFIEAISLTREALEIYKKCNDETDQGFLAGVYLCRGIARFYLEGKYSENAKENFLEAKQIYEKKLQLQQNSSKDVQHIYLLASMFENVEDIANYELCQKMFHENTYSGGLIDMYNSYL